MQRKEEILYTIKRFIEGEMSMSTNQEYDSGHETEQEPEEFAFLEEKIKDATFDVKKATSKVLKLVSMGLLFGIAASIGFFALKPWAESTFQKEAQRVEIPEDEEEIQTGEPEVDSEVDSEIIENRLTLEDYIQLNSYMVGIASKVQESIVYVTDGEQDETGVSGLIVAENEIELLILVDTSSLDKVGQYKVRFVDNVSYTATLKQSTSTIDMGIVSVPKDSISELTWSRIGVAELGNSVVLSKGKLLIAVGNLYGYGGEISYGIASSVGKKVTPADGEYSMVITDIAGSINSNGFLFDTDGKVVGVIDSEIAEKTQGSVLAAYGISNIKREIKLMSYGEAIPYIGIKGTIVTETIAAERNIPEGLYVTEVEADSPAMLAGIQNGDIITSIANEDVITLAGYHSVILAAEIGSEIRLEGLRYGAERYVELRFNVTVGQKQ